MSDYNGSSLGLAVILGELRADSRHTTAALENINEEIRNTNATIERQNDILLDLPTQIALKIATPASATPHPSTLAETTSALKAIPPILKAAVPILTIIGLMSGRISWLDLLHLISPGGP
jgi:hypothetical protein